MTLKELRKVFDRNVRIHLTALGYYKESKKYYSFMTIYSYDDDVNFSNEDAFSDDKWFMNCEVKNVRIDDIHLYTTAWIDIIEWIEGTGEES